MAKAPEEKLDLFGWLLFGRGPGPGEELEYEASAQPKDGTIKKAVKCDMCKDLVSGAACVRACPTGAAARVSPEKFMTLASLG